MKRHYTHARCHHIYHEQTSHKQSDLVVQQHIPNAHNYVTLLNADEILITDSANLIGTIIGFKTTNQSLCMVGEKSKETSR